MSLLSVAQWLIYPGLAKKLEPYRVTRDEEMPAPYRKGARDLSDDWGIMTKNPILLALQPWQKVTRMKRARKVPFPFVKLEGTQEPKWTPWNGSYPIAPNTEVRLMPYNESQAFPHILTMHPVYDEGWSRQAAYIDGVWIECYYTSSTMILGKRFTRYEGLRADLHLKDAMCWYPEASISWKAVKKNG